MEVLEQFFELDRHRSLCLVPCVLALELHPGLHEQIIALVVRNNPVTA
jgi:hypothetical protein